MAAPAGRNVYRNIDYECVRTPEEWHINYSKLFGTLVSLRPCRYFLNIVLKNRRLQFRRRKPCACFNEPAEIGLAVKVQFKGDLF